MRKSDIIDMIGAYVPLIDDERERLQTMTLKQLWCVEFLVNRAIDSQDAVCAAEEEG